MKIMMDRLAKRSFWGCFAKKKKKDWKDKGTKLKKCKRNHLSSMIKGNDLNILYLDSTLIAIVVIEIYDC